MKLTIALLILLLAPLTGYAVDLTCTVPGPAMPRLNALCSDLQAQHGVRSADWSNDICATHVLRARLEEVDRVGTREASRAGVRAAADMSAQSFAADYPRVVIPARCGDGVVDAQRAEQCDDGNTDIGDGCDEMCQDE